MPLDTEPNTSEFNDDPESPADPQLTAATGSLIAVWTAGIGGGIL